MRSQGQRQSLGALLQLKARLAIRQELLLREERLLTAELTTTEELLKKQLYKETIAVQSHLAAQAAVRLKALSERVTEGELSIPMGQEMMNAEFAQADERYYGRLQFIEGPLFAREEAAQGFLQATQALESRRLFIAALQQHEREEAILKWIGENPDSIKQWKEQDWHRIYAQAADDTHRDDIIAAGDVFRVKEDVKSAKAIYLALLGEVTLLLDQVRGLQSLLTDSEIERRQIERRAKNEAQMLGRMYPLNLFSGQSELDAYHSASESLSAARNMHSKRLEATRQKYLSAQITQIHQLLAMGRGQNVLSEESARQVRASLNSAVSERNLDALAQIRRELAVLIGLSEQAKGSLDEARVFEGREHGAITVITGAVANATGPLSTLQARSEASKATGLARELDEATEAIESHQHQNRTRF